MSQKSILLLHGALGSKAQFKALENALAQSFEVHVLTFEGHGGRTSDRPFSMTHFVENVVKYLDEHKLDSIDIFGYSMGGYVALMLAKMHPNRVNRIMTLGTKFAWNPEFSAMEVRKLNPDKIEEKVPRFAQFLEKVHAPLDWKKVVTDTANMMIDLGNERPLEKHYSAISCPTLITLGSLDNMSTEEESKFVAEQLPKGEFELIPDLEHPIEKVNVSELSRRIESFYKS
ncbi:MAG: alpha/beta hydrolase [Crocinitomicaceae bacterium]|nr:alpha/beta hydrolase [Crocinitomicaceae bacterium]